jgi:uncharacterized protein
MIGKIAAEVGCRAEQVSSTLKLLEGGATVPFISRYRKEATGGLDEVQIGNIQDLHARYLGTGKTERSHSCFAKRTRCADGRPAPKSRGRSHHPRAGRPVPALSPQAQDRATKAIELGLEPLAKLLMAQNERFPETAAQRFVKGEVGSVEDALQGARDIIAEWMNENAALRARLRQVFLREATISSKMVKGKELDGEKFRDYFKHEEPLRRVPSHRFLAMMRGENEGFLKVGIAPPEEGAAANLGAVLCERQHRQQRPRATCGQGCLQAFAATFAGDRDAQLHQGAGGRAGHQGICRKSAAVAHASALG